VTQIEKGGRGKRKCTLHPKKDGASAGMRAFLSGDASCLFFSAREKKKERGGGGKRGEGLPHPADGVREEGGKPGRVTLVLLDSRRAFAERGHLLLYLEKGKKKEPLRQPVKRGDARGMAFRHVRKTTPKLASS